MNSAYYLKNAKKTEEVVKAALQRRTLREGKEPFFEDLPAFIAYGRLCAEIAAITYEEDQRQRESDDYNAQMRTVVAEQNGE